MKQKQIIALALIVIGAGLIFWGYQMSGSVTARLSKTLTGSFTDNVMWRYIGGAVCIVMGGFLFKK